MEGSAGSASRRRRGRRAVRQVPGGGPGVATIAGVAERAGVSRATVSRVMNGRTTVSPELTARVLEAARALDYVPSMVARSLAIGRTSTVALVVPDLADPTFQEVLRGLSQGAAEQGHRLLVAETNADAGAEESLAVEARRRCDGLVLASSRLPAAQLRRLAPTLAPLVLLDRRVPDPDVPWLMVDHARGVRRIVAHLLGLGHRRLAYLAGPAGGGPDHDRRRALVELSDGGRAFELVEVGCGSTFDAGRAAAGAAAGTGATAMVAFNDMVAFGAISGLHELGVDVPDEISVTGFDDIPFARCTRPPLTTAAVPRNELGRQAWRRLWALLSGGVPDPSLELPPRLEVRGSTGPARR